MLHVARESVGARATVRHLGPKERARERLRPAPLLIESGARRRDVEHVEVGSTMAGFQGECNAAARTWPRGRHERPLVDGDGIGLLGRHAIISSRAESSDARSDDARPFRIIGWEASDSRIFAQSKRLRSMNEL